MQLGRLFKESKLEGTLGLYPLTPENLIRIGLAICTLLRIDRNQQRPTLYIDELNFLTMSLSVGFMYGGGDVILGESGNFSVKSSINGSIGLLHFIDLKEDDLKKLEAILFSRYNIPKKEGKEIGELWIQKKTL